MSKPLIESLRSRKLSRFGYVELSRKELRDLLACVEAASDPFLVVLESHPNAEGPANAEMARAAERFRAALKLLTEEE